MMKPGLVVNAIRQLHEGIKILRAKVKLCLWSTKVERSIRSQIPLGIFASVTAPFELRLFSLDDEGFFRSPSKPHCSGARLQFSGGNLRSCFADSMGKTVERFLCLFSNCDYQVDLLKHRLCYPVWMNGDQDKAGERLRDICGRGRPVVG